MQVTQNHDEVLIKCTVDEAENLMKCIGYCYEESDDDGTPEVLMEYIKAFINTLEVEQKP